MASLEQIAREGQGLLVYLHVAGGARPDELLARMRGHLRPEEAARSGPLKGELREMGTGAQILLDMGVRRLRLMTNNPRKIVGLEGYGIEVAERVPLEVARSETNRSFLEARRTRMGHLLSAVPDDPDRD
jgi:3,4-dihydroxy 2-butanone 4-phosphate synthase/GTP cyclohydrolase II